MWFQQVWSGFRNGLVNVAKFIDRNIPTIVRTAKWVASAFHSSADPRISALAHVATKGLDAVEAGWRSWHGKSLNKDEYGEYIDEPEIVPT